jgi:AAA domain
MPTPEPKTDSAQAHSAATGDSRPKSAQTDEPNGSGRSSRSQPGSSNGSGGGNDTSSGEARKHRYQLVRFEKGLRNINRKVCLDHPVFSFLALPERDDQEGLFPRGELSLIAGASGSWKTTVFLAFIKTWTNGDRFFGRRTCRGNGKYLIVSFDRSKNGFARTAVRMGEDPNNFNLIELGPEDLDRDPREIIADIAAQTDFQGLQFMFIEGIDLKAGDVAVARQSKGGIGDSHLVSKMMTALQKIAERYHFALIASVGSPKQKSSDKYSSKRDQIIGSQAWARVTETVVHLAQADENDPNNHRTLSFLPRNGRDEEIRIMLDEHNCPVRAPETPTATEKDPLWMQISAWLRSDKSGINPSDTFTVKQVADAFPKEQYDNVAQTLRRMPKHKENGIEHVGHGKYKRAGAQKDPYVGRV